MLASLLLMANLTLAAPVLPVQDDDEQRPSSAAQRQCGRRDEIIQAIKQRYGAEPLFVAMTEKQGVAFEVWHNTFNVKEVGDMWIGFLSRSDGISCVILRGATWGLANPSETGSDNRPSEEN